MALFIPSRLVVTSAIIALLFSHFVSSHDSAAATQNEPTQQIPGMPVIIHDPVECAIENKHPLFQASVQARGGPRTVKIYFHAQDYDDFYYVEMAQAGDVWQASLPIAAPETRGFLYYIEVVDLSFNTSRTAEFTTKVTGENECDRRDEGAPPIVVGSTTAGATPVPGGFLTTGISRVIASSGAAQAVGGGIGATTGVIIAAGAAGAGLAILGGGSDEPEPEPEAPPTVDPPPGGGGGGDDPTPPTEPEPEGTAPVACFTTDPKPPVVDVNDAVGFNASCSTADEPLRAQIDDKIETYQWRFNDGRADKEGQVVNHLYVTAGTFPAQLTVTDSAGNKDTREVDVVVRSDTPPPGGGGGGGGPDLRVNVTRSPPGNVPAGNDIEYTISVVYDGGTASNVRMSANLTGPIKGAPNFGGFTSCGFTPTSVNCGPTNGSSFAVKVTVGPVAPPSNSCSASVSTTSPDSNPGNNSDGASATVSQRSPDVIPVELKTAFTSRLDVPPPNGSVRGQVLLNGTQLDQTDNSAPFRHHPKGQKGKNTVDARVVSGTGEGRWVFNLSRAPHFVGGSLVVESGQVISRGSGRVIFRVGPSSGPIKFRFRLSP